MRLPRVKMLVLAGSLMGGEITKAVEEVRAHGLNVISLNMAGSVPDAADLVVSDPVQAGVMAVMAVADTAKFDLMRQLKRRILRLMLIAVVKRDCPTCTLIVPVLRQLARHSHR